MHPYSADALKDFNRKGRKENRKGRKEKPEINDIKANRAAVPASTDIMPCNVLPSWGTSACAVPRRRGGGGHDGQRFYPGILAGRGARRCRETGRCGNCPTELDRRSSPICGRHFGRRRVRFPSNCCR